MNDVSHVIVAKAVRRMVRLSILSCVFILSMTHNGLAQVRSGSPSNWLFPLGNPEATRRQEVPSDRQDISTMIVKWSNSRLRGDVQPLVGNLSPNVPVGRINTMNDQPIFNKFAPNEIVASIGNTIVVLNGGTGETIVSSNLSNELNFLGEVSFLYDGQSPTPIPQDQTSPGLMMGLSIFESAFGQPGRSAAAVSYMANLTADTVRILKMFMSRLDEYGVNNYASTRPFYSRISASGNDTLMFAQMNMTNPDQTSPMGLPPYFRGIAQYNTRNFTTPPFRPLVVDTVINRLNVGFNVSSGQPSIRVNQNRQINALLPVRSTPGFTALMLNYLGFDASTGETPFITPVRLDSNIMAPGDFRIVHQDLTALGINFANQPLLRPLYVDLNPDGLRDFTLVLISEEYGGVIGSTGTPRLHLFNPVTSTFFTQVGSNIAPPFSLGTSNHGWSIAIGDVDGNIENSVEPEFPNNRGKEIIMSQTTRDFDVPGSSLCVLRFRTDALTPRPRNLGGVLNQLDTIATQKINGWVAAVNDFDSAPDGKEEIFVVYGDSLKIYRMRSYTDPNFFRGNKFELVWAYRFFGDQRITSVVVAATDGDGINDVVVTTLNKTYLLGTRDANALQLAQPSRIFDLDPNARPSACIGSAVEFTYRVNVFPRTMVPRMNVYYQPYTANGVATGRRILLDSNVNIANNPAPSAVYRAPATLSQFGLFGRFIIESTNDNLVRDSSAIIQFTTSPAVRLVDLPSGITRRLNDTITVFGVGQCVTGLQMQYFNRTIGQFVPIAANIVSGGGVFSATMRLPECLPGAFTCGTSPTSAFPIDFRVVSTSITGGTQVVSNRVTVSVLPNSYDLVVSDNDVPPNQICQARYFAITNLPPTLTVTTLSYSYSLNNGISFIPIGTQPYTPGSTTALVTWVPPPDLPSEVLVRICSDGGCINGQGILKNPSPTFINSVAPNPFNPSVHGMVNTIYTLPQNGIATVRIFDSNNRLVKEIGGGGDLISNAAYRACWAGNLANGTPAGQGMYYIVVEFKARRSTYPLFLQR